MRARAAGESNRVQLNQNAGGLSLICSGGDFCPTTFRSLFRRLARFFAGEVGRHARCDVFAQPARRSTLSHKIMGEGKDKRAHAVKLCENFPEGERIEERSLFSCAALSLE
jgi:hypothetical protein